MRKRKQKGSAVKSNGSGRRRKGTIADRVKISHNGRREKEFDGQLAIASWS